jgi:antitoxin component of RelBE/YafQ-DinJ toxin-antitoxin module
MAGKKRYDDEVRLRLSADLKETLKGTAERLELTESDVMRMLIKNLQLKGIEKVIGES